MFISPNIFSYDNYRSFLQDWFAFMKENKDGFSLRTFSLWAGFKSPNHFQLVVQGKRNITSETLSKFLKVLKLKRKEQKYFELLVAFNQAKAPEEKALRLQALAQLTKKYGIHLQGKQYEYLLRWYYPVIRELVTTQHFLPNATTLAKKIGHGITARQVREAIQKLLDLGLLKKDPRGKLVQNFELLTTGDEARDASAYVYHDQMLALARQALREQAPQERYVAGITLACSPKDLPELTQILNDCRQHVLGYLEGRVDKSKDDDVYQLGLQLFRITKQGGRS